MPVGVAATAGSAGSGCWANHSSEPTHVAQRAGTAALMLHSRGEAACVRAGEPSDLNSVCDLYRAELCREPQIARVTHFLTDFPSAVALREGLLVDFAYGVRFAPDNIGLANIVDSTEQRDVRLGAVLLARFEEGARTAGFRGVILVNSDLYPAGRTLTRSASRFYLRNGYELLRDTGSTRVFFKTL